MAASTSSGFHRYSSWGRTRRPKNVNGAESTAHAVSTTAYFTENQRFLHVVCGSAAKVTKIELYYHGAGAWSTLFVPHNGGSLVQAATTDGNTVVFEIAGADKVRVTHDGSNANDDEKVWLLLSTF